MVAQTVAGEGMARVLGALGRGDSPSGRGKKEKWAGVLGEKQWGCPGAATSRKRGDLQGLAQVLPSALLILKAGSNSSFVSSP